MAVVSADDAPVHARREQAVELADFQEEGVTAWRSSPVGALLAATFLKLWEVAAFYFAL